MLLWVEHIFPPRSCFARKTFCSHRSADGYCVLFFRGKKTSHHRRRSAFASQNLFPPLPIITIWPRRGKSEQQRSYNVKLISQRFIMLLRYRKRSISLTAESSVWGKLSGTECSWKAENCFWQTFRNSSGIFFERFVFLGRRKQTVWSCCFLINVSYLFDQIVEKYFTYLKKKNRKIIIRSIFKIISTQSVK